MGPSFQSFADEVLFLKKQAEPDEPQQTPEAASAAPVQSEEKPPFKSDFRPMASERLKSALKFGLGTGIGAGAGYLVGEKLLPKVLPQGAWPPATMRNVGYGISGLSAIGALALWDAMNQAAKAEADVLERQRQGV